MSSHTVYTYHSTIAHQLSKGGLGIFLSGEGEESKPRKERRFSGGNTTRFRMELTIIERRKNNKDFI